MVIAADSSLPTGLPLAADWVAACVAAASETTSLPPLPLPLPLPIQSSPLPTLLLSNPPMLPLPLKAGLVQQ